MKQSLFNKIFTSFLVFVFTFTLILPGVQAQVTEDPDYALRQDNFIVTGPTILNYQTTSENNLEMYFTTNYASEYCGLEYVEVSEPLGFTAAGFNHAEVAKTPVERGDNLYEYRGVIREFKPNVEYYVRPFCKYGEQERSGNAIIFTKDVQETAATFVVKGPTVDNYSQNSEGNLEFTFTANFDGTCWGQYDSTNSFNNATEVATSLIENPTVANGNLYKYKAVVTTLTEGATYFVRPYCVYDGQYYSGTDFAWVHPVKQESQQENQTTVKPSVTIDSYYTDAQNNIYFDWKTKGLANCYALMSLNVDTSIPSMVEPTRTSLGNDAYLFKSMIPSAFNNRDYYMQAVCKLGEKEYTSAWFELKTRNLTSAEDSNSNNSSSENTQQEERVQLPDPSITLGTLRINDKNDITLKWKTERLSACEAVMSINADKSQQSVISAQKTQTGAVEYSYEATIPAAIPNTIYYVRAQCQSGNEYKYSSWKGIASSGPAADTPTTVPEVNLVTAHTNGNISFDVRANYRGACGVQYSRFDNMTPGFLVDAQQVTGNGPYKYDVLVSQMQPNTTYYYRPYCTVNNRTLIGDINWLETPRRTEARSNAIEEVRAVNNATDEMVDLADDSRNEIAVTPVRQRINNDEVNERARKLVDDKTEELLKEIEVLRDKLRESQVKVEYLTGLLKKEENSNVPEEIQDALADFITYGADEKTKSQGERQRGSVIYSYEEAFGRLPETEDEVADVILLAQGNAPFVRNEQAEKKAFEDFRKVYYRVPDLSDPYDKNAITIMAYGMLNGGPRNIDSEAAALATYKDVYGTLPQNTHDWNVLRAITYSGSARLKDTDGDGVSDKLEAKLGSNPKLADTDGDGYPDATEYLTGYNVNGPGRL